MKGNKEYPRRPPKVEVVKYYKDYLEELVEPVRDSLSFIRSKIKN